MSESRAELVAKCIGQLVETEEAISVWERKHGVHEADRNSLHRAVGILYVMSTPSTDRALFMLERALEAEEIEVERSGERLAMLKAHRKRMLGAFSSDETYPADYRDALLHPDKRVRELAVRLAGSVAQTGEVGHA